MPGYPGLSREKYNALFKKICDDEQFRTQLDKDFVGTLKKAGLEVKLPRDFLSRYKKIQEISRSRDGNSCAACAICVICVVCAEADALSGLVGVVGVVGI